MTTILTDTEEPGEPERFDYDAASAEHRIARSRALTRAASALAAAGRIGQRRPAPVPAFSYCESKYASSRTWWHIRFVGRDTLHPGGGLTTTVLCGRPLEGWDLGPAVDSASVTRLAAEGDGQQRALCPGCADQWVKETA